MTTRSIAALVIAAGVTICCTACGSTSVSPSSVASIALNGAATPIAVGTTGQVRVVVTLTDGSAQDVTSSSQLQSSNTAIATVDANGVVTGVSPGTTTILATYQTLNASTTITVTPPAPAS